MIPQLVAWARRRAHSPIRWRTASSSTGATLPGQDGNPGAIRVGLDSLDGAVRTTLDASGDSVARAHVDNWVLSDTHIVATASDLAVDATVAFSGGLDAEATELSIDFSSFDLAIGSIPGWLPGLFVEAAKGIIGRVIAGRLGPIVGDVLRSLEGESSWRWCIPACRRHPVLARLPARRRRAARRPARRPTRRRGAPRRGRGPGAPWREGDAPAAPAGGQMAVAVGGNL